MEMFNNLLTYIKFKLQYPSQIWSIHLREIHFEERVLWRETKMVHEIRKLTYRDSLGGYICAHHGREKSMGET